MGDNQYEQLNNLEGAPPPVANNQYEVGASVSKKSGAGASEKNVKSAVSQMPPAAAPQAKSQMKSTMQSPASGLPKTGSGGQPKRSGGRKRGFCASFSKAQLGFVIGWSVLLVAIGIALLLGLFLPRMGESMNLPDDE
ncbi:hypothetical protein M3Y99_01361400 [Aphelenchoides fujianensis]|nr:hypothetical protein M3Y99_01361400 [Aphelenchoides fujianensis]